MYSLTGNCFSYRPPHTPCQFCDPVADTCFGHPLIATRELPTTTLTSKGHVHPANWKLKTFEACAALYNEHGQDALFYEGGVCRFKIEREDYHSLGNSPFSPTNYSPFFIVFGRVNSDVCFITQTECDRISLRDMHNEVLRSWDVSDPEFISNFHVSGNLLLLQGWFWHPVLQEAFYDLREAFSAPETWKPLVSRNYFDWSDEIPEERFKWKIVDGKAAFYFEDDEDTEDEGESEQQKAKKRTQKIMTLDELCQHKLSV